MVIAGFFKLVFYLVVAYIIYQIIRIVFAPPKRSRTGRPAQQSSGKMVKDEVCKTYLSQEDAIREKIGGSEYFFCSQACRQKFLEQKKNKGTESSA